MHPSGPAALLIMLGVQAAGGQVADSASRLPDRTVTVTRGADSLHRLGASVSVVAGSAVSRGRVATGLDESLAFVPGLLVANRWNYSLDQRLSIRGFGARANFGLRGVKVLLDGVPQTLPDGQSQLSNVDLPLVDRVEVLRGAASALEGNAAGGVIAFTTRVAPAAPSEFRAAFEAGSFATSRVQLAASARTGDVAGSIAVSRFATDGSRLHSAAAQRRASVALDWAPWGSVMVTIRAAAADDPQAENPGALTSAELAVNRDTAAAGNIMRRADKSITQQQLAIGARNVTGPVRWSITVFGLRRDLQNPLATPPPQATAPDQGTYVSIDRAVGGLRASAGTKLSPGPRAPHLTIGLDAQWMQDDRENRRATAGVPATERLVDQRERVREFGPFAQVTIPVTSSLGVRVGGRYDRVRFAVDDHLLGDGDASGARTMSSTSGHVALTYAPNGNLTTWLSVATSFETPTTTELANRVEGDGGFNAALDPQRSVSSEAGARWRGGGFAAEVAAYRTVTRDALIAYRENAGRTYFRNAGRTRTLGAEASLTATLAAHVAAVATWTHTNATFAEYLVVDGGGPISLAGNRLAGIPAHVARIGLRGAIGRGIRVDVDHAWSSMMYADDRNTIGVDGWGAGVTGARVQWEAAAARYRFTPFVAVTNLFGRDYVGSVTINGGFGRVFEPAAGRAVYAGMSIVAAAP